MKLLYLAPTVLFAATTLLAACSADTEESATNTPQLTIVTKAADNALFPVDDGSKTLNTTPAMALLQLMLKVEPARALSMGETVATEEQYAEIKAFVDENLAKSTPENTYKAILSWITSNLTYASSGDAYLNPYEVFINKRCVCQGYANLLKTMCLTQGIPAFCVNGQYGSVGAHAWNYVCINQENKKWKVSDPTNAQDFSMLSSSDYKNKLIPQRIDFDLYEDEAFTYNFAFGGLNVSSVKDSTATVLTLPFSALGYQVSTFSPTKVLPTSIKTLYFGKNITSLGDNVEALDEYTPSVEEIFMDEDNPTYIVEDNILYERGATMPTYIPTATRRVVLKAMTTMGKNTVTNLPYVEEIVIGAGTEVVEAYAIENCPNLKRVYVPETVTDFSDEAIYHCNSNVEILRTSTGIHHVTL